MNIFIFISLFVIFIVSTKADENNNNNVTESSDEEFEPVLLFQKKLQNLDKKSNSFKIISSYNETNGYFIEIVSKYEYQKNPISSKIYRMPDTIKLTPREFMQIIEFLAKSTSGKHKVINIGLEISRFDQPFYVTLSKPVSVANPKYKIQIFDWMEIKELISYSSNILHHTYNYF